MSIQNSYSASQFVSDAIGGAKQFVRELVTVDRSYQHFYTNSAGKICVRQTQKGDQIDAIQLKGRSRLVHLMLSVAGVGGLFFGLALLQALMHGGVGNWFMVGGAGFLGGAALKEVVVQSYARYKEQKENQIEESDKTRYGFGDLVRELGDTVSEDWTRLMHWCTGVQMENAETVELIDKENNKGKKS